MSNRTVRVTLIAQATGYIQGMQAAQKATQQTATEAEKLAAKREAFQQLGQSMVVVGGAITAVGVAALRTGIQYNTLQQTTRAALTTLLGSAEAANAQMDKLDDFARNSPFAKQTFITAQQQMLAFGIETRKVIPYLDAVQNAVAAAGGSNADIEAIAATMSKIQSAAKITGQDLIEFGNRGINAAELIGSQMGMTGAEIREAITNGSIGATQALDALAAGMAESFAGASDGVKNTFAGAMDRMKAAWRDFSSELAAPLVDPNGNGGALIELLNWTADMMRAFLALPKPIRDTISVLTLLTGAVMLAGGAAILAIPKWVAFQATLATLNITAATTVGRLSGVAKFMTGPWGVGLAAGLVGLKLLETALKSGQASAEEIENALLNASDAAALFDTLGQGKEIVYFRDVTADLGDMSGMLDKVRDQNDNWWKRFTTETHGFRGAVREAGAAIAEMATRDLPSAQRAFNTFTEGQNLSQKQLLTLIGEMPGFREALTQQATALGINLSQMSEYERNTYLVGLAQGTVAGGTEELAVVFDAQSEAVRKATYGLRDNEAELDKMTGAARIAGMEIDALSDKVRGFASVTLSAREAERAYQEAIDAVTASVEQNGSTLDRTTEAGRANEAAIDALAQKTLNHAAAVWEQTGSQQEATAALQAGRDELINQLAQFGITGQAAEDYADMLGLIPSNIQTAMELLTSNAVAAVEAFLNTYNGKKVTVDMFLDTTNGDRSAAAAAARYTGLGQRYLGRASGGDLDMAPGPKGVDSMLFRGARGEHVLTASEVDRMGGQSAVYKFRRDLMSGASSAAAVRPPQAAMVAPSARSLYPSGSGGQGSSVAVDMTVRADDPATVAGLVVQNLEARLAVTS